MANPRCAWKTVYLVALMAAALPLAAAGQAVMGAFSSTPNVVVFPSPNTGLPNPTQNNVSGLPVSRFPHGVSFYGSDNALVADVFNSRVFVIQVSTATLLGTISTAPYDGSGTIAVAPSLNFALASGGTSVLYVIAAPFGPTSTINTVALPGGINQAQTEAIVFNAAGRAFVYHSSGISVLDYPYTSIAFTIGGFGDGSIAISPDGNTLLITDGTNSIQVFTAPFSAASVPSGTITIPGAGFLDGIAATPDGTRALVVTATAGVNALFSIAAPFTSSSTVDTIPLPASVGPLEDVGISADSQLAILTGASGSNTNTPFVRAPFTAVGATVFNVQVPGGRGVGSVRFLPPGLAPGLTISKSGPASAASGTDITYTITYGNTGAAAVNNVIIKDPVPAGTSFVSATAGGTFSAGTVTWNIGTVNAGVTGQTVSFTVNVTATSGTISNVNYTIEGTGVAPIAGPPVFTQVGIGLPTPTPTPTGSATATPTPTGSATATPTSTPVPTGADLSVLKSASPNPAQPGQNLTYTIGVSNAGPQSAASVSVTDPLPAGTTFVSCSTSQGTCSGPPVGTNGTVTATLGTIASGGSATFMIVVNVTAQNGTLHNTATGSSATFDPNPGNNAGIAVIAVGAAGAAIPTLSPWMLLLLGLALAGIGFLTMKRGV